MSLPPEISGRDLLMRFWLVTGLLVGLLLAMGVLGMQQLSANRERSETGLAFSHLADAEARLQLAMGEALRDGSATHRAALSEAWHSVAHHLEEILHADAATAGAAHDEQGNPAMRARAQAVVQRHMAPDGRRPHGLGGLAFPDSLQRLWHAPIRGVPLADAMSERLVVLEPLVDAQGSLNEAERALLIALHGSHDRAAMVEALHQGSMLMLEEFRTAGHTLQLNLGLAVACGVAALVASLVFLLRPLALRVEADRTALTAALERAQAGQKARTEFLATMSHELRTPLNGVIGMAALLGSTRLDGRQQGCVETIRSSAEALAGVIDDILEFSRFDSGRLRLHRAPYDIVDLARSPARKLAPAAVLRGLHLLVRLDPALPRQLTGDRDRLDHVISNLIANAIKFTPSGKVVVDIRGRPGAAGSIVLRIMVRDTGPGVAPADRARIFEPFVQGDQSATRAKGGVGLGLAISKRLVEMMGGQIGLLPGTPGEGATFWVEVEQPVADPRPWALPDPTLAGLRVAALSHCGECRDLLAEWLEAWGASVEPGVDTGLLWDDLDAPPPDVVILDHAPPGADAAESLRQMTDLMPQVPVVVLSSVDAAFEHPAHAVLRKPVEPTELARVLRDMLGGPAAGPVQPRKAAPRATAALGA